MFENMNETELDVVEGGHFWGVMAGVLSTASGVGLGNPWLVGMGVVEIIDNL